MRMEEKPLARDFDSFAYAAQRPRRQNPFAKHLELQLHYNTPQIHDKNNHSTFVLALRWVAFSGRMDKQRLQFGFN